MEKKYNDWRDDCVRVSTVLSRLNDFSKIPQHILLNKQRIGSNVHAAIKYFIEGQFPSFLDIPELGYFESFQKWIEIAHPSFILTEQRYWDNTKMLTGQIDALIELESEKTSILIDFKTSVKESPAVWPMQAHLYYYLMIKNNVENLSKKFIFVKLDKKGAFPDIYTYDFDQSTYEKALKEVDLYWESQI